MHHQGDQIVLQRGQLVQRLVLPGQQLVLAAQPQEVPHPQGQFLAVHRLRQEVVGARLQAGLAIGPIAERRDQQHRQQVGAGRSLDLPADIEAAHARHHHVQDHQVDAPLGQHRQRRGAVLGLAHVVVFRQ